MHRLSLLAALAVTLTAGGARAVTLRYQANQAGDFVLIGNTNTGPSTLNLNGLGAHSVKRATGANVNPGDLQQGMVAGFVFDGTNYQLINFLGFTSDTTLNNFTTQIPFAVDTGAVNAVVGIFNPVVTALAAGNPFLVKVMNTNTGPVTVKCNSLTAVQLIWPNGTQLGAGDIVTGGIMFIVFDGAKMQLLYHLKGGEGPSGPSGPMVNLRITASRVSRCWSMRLRRTRAEREQRPPHS